MSSTTSPPASPSVPNLNKLPPDNPYRDNDDDTPLHIELLAFSIDVLRGAKAKSRFERLPYEVLRNIFVNSTFMSRTNLSLASKHFAAVAGTSNALTVDRTIIPNIDTYHYFTPETSVIWPRPPSQEGLLEARRPDGVRLTHILCCKLCSWEEMAVSGERPRMGNRRMLAAVHHVRAHVNIDGNMFTKGMAWLVRDYLEVAYDNGRMKKTFRLCN